MQKIKTLMIGLLVACTAGTGFAQKMNAEQRATKAVEQLSKVVTDLTEKQKDELKAVNLKQSKDMMAFRKSAMASGDATAEQKEASREKMKALRAEKTEAYKKILNAQQFKQYKEWTIQQQQKAKQGKKAKGKKKTQDT